MSRRTQQHRSSPRVEGAGLGESCYVWRSGDSFSDEQFGFFVSRIRCKNSHRFFQSEALSVMKRIISIIVVSVLCSFGAFADDNWPQWRGPTGIGKTSAAAGITSWGPTTNIRWRTELPEAGNSTPIVYGDKIFLTQPLSDSRERGMMCFDRATGNELWRRGVRYTADEPTHRTNPYCSASPVADDDRVIAWLGSAGLVCWDHAGKELWRRDLGTLEHRWGYGSSPILHDQLCIVNFGPGSREFLIAVDKRSGETVWKVDAWDDVKERELSGPENDGNANDFTRDDDRSERLRGSWSTPIIVNIDGKSQLVATLPRRLASFDPVNGALNWVCGGGAPLAYASPMASAGIVVALGGYGGASLAVRCDGEDDVTDSRRLWHEPKDSGWLGTGVIQDGALYAADMSGILSCRDIETGEVLWKERTEGGSTWSTVTQDASGLMFLLSKSGTTTVFRPDKEKFDLVASNSLGETTNASIVIAGNDILIRTDEALWSIGK